MLAATDANDVALVASTSEVPTLSELLTAVPDTFLAKYTDVAAINLGCARGLPSVIEADFPAYMALLDRMAEAVRVRTEKSWRLFKLKPAEFHRSENVFRVLTMEHVLRMQFGVKYDPIVSAERQTDKTRPPADASEMFVHGVLGSKRTGTCSSLPTFSIAIGRRLGYPLKLIRVPNHTLFRWDDGTERFNVQHTDSGSKLVLDEYFHTWPRVWDADMHAMNDRTKVWLHSLTPLQEASKFLCNRAIICRCLGRLDDGLAAVVSAARFDPGNPACSDIEFDLRQRSSFRQNRAGEIQTYLSSELYSPRLYQRVEPSGQQLIDTSDPFRSRVADGRGFRVNVVVAQAPTGQTSPSVVMQIN